MSEVQTLRDLLQQVLTAAAHQIFAQIEMTISRYEKTISRQQQLLDVVLQPEVKLQSVDVRLLSREVSPELQARSPRLDEVEPSETPDNVDQGEQLPAPEGVKPGVHALLKIEDEEKPQSTLRRHSEALKTEGDGWICLEPDGDFNPDVQMQPDTHNKASRSESETGDTSNSEENAEPLSFLNRPIKNEEPEHNSGGTPVGPEGSASVRQEKPLQGRSGIQTGPNGSVAVRRKRSRREKAFVTRAKCHSKGKRLSCSKCGKKFSRKATLASHMKVHLEEAAPVLSCAVCGRLCKWQSNLTAHMTVHTKEKMFSCSLCGKRYKWRSALKVHMERHTKDKFSCPYCDRKYSWRSSLGVHMKHHLEGGRLRCSV